jgi:hypothetical protein
MARTEKEEGDVLLFGAGRGSCRASAAMEELLLATPHTQRRQRPRGRGACTRGLGHGEEQGAGVLPRSSAMAASAGRPGKKQGAWAPWLLVAPCCCRPREHSEMGKKREQRRRAMGRKTARHGSPQPWRGGASWWLLPPWSFFCYYGTCFNRLLPYGTFKITFSIIVFIIDITLQNSILTFFNISFSFHFSSSSKLPVMPLV